MRYFATDFSKDVIACTPGEQHIKNLITVMKGYVQSVNI